MCRSNLGIIIAERTEEDNVQAIRGQCAMCGYEIAWALIRSKPTTHIPPRHQVNASGKIRDSNSVLAPGELRFIEPMYARLVQKVPEGNEWLYEVKFDG